MGDSKKCMEREQTVYEGQLNRLEQVVSACSNVLGSLRGNLFEAERAEGDEEKGKPQPPRMADRLELIIDDLQRIAKVIDDTNAKILDLLGDCRL